MSLKPTNGGARKGAGRKPMPEIVQGLIRLTPEHWAIAEKLGKGNKTAGIRVALEKCKNSCTD